MKNNHFWRDKLANFLVNEVRTKGLMDFKCGVYEEYDPMKNSRFSKEEQIEFSAKLLYESLTNQKLRFKL